MNLKKTILLGVIFIALLGYIIRIELPKDEQAKKADMLLRDISAAQISSIELSSKKGRLLLINASPALQPKGASPEVAEVLGSIDQSILKLWELADIKGAELDRATLNSLLTSLLGFKTEGAIAEKDIESDLGVYGLKEPELSIQVKVGERGTEIQFGKMNEYVRRRYAKVSGRPGIFLVADDLFSAGQKSRNDLRSKTPIDFADSEVRRITLLSKEQGEVVFEVFDSYHWRIIQPGKFTASDSAVSNLMRELRNLRALDFIDDAAGKLEENGLRTPQLRVKLEFSESTKRQPLEVLLSDVPAKDSTTKSEGAVFFVNGGPSIYKLAASPISRIAKPVVDFRERQLFRFDTGEVTLVEINESAKDSVSIKKEKDIWTRGTTQLAAEKVLAFLSTLSELRADSFAQGSAAELGFVAPRLRIAIRSPGVGDQKETERILTVGASVPAQGKKEERYYVAVDDLSEPFVVTRASVDAVLAKFAEIESTTGTSVGAPTAVAQEPTGEE